MARHWSRNPMMCATRRSQRRLNPDTAPACRSDSMLPERRGYYMAEKKKPVAVLPETNF